LAVEVEAKEGLGMEVVEEAWERRGGRKVGGWSAEVTPEEERVEEVRLFEDRWWQAMVEVGGRGTVGTGGGEGGGREGG